MLFKFVIATLCWMSVYAQTAPPCTLDGTRPIRGQGELDALAGCRTIEGTVRISNYAGTSAKLAGVQIIQGNLLFEHNYHLLQISLPDLQQVSGTFTLHNHTQLTQVDMPRMRAIKTLNVQVNPTLSKLNFPSGLVSNQHFRIVDSMLESVEGLLMEEANEIEFSANRYLTSVQLNELKIIHERLLITSNADQVHFSAPRLTSIKGNTTLTQLASMTLDALEQLGSGLHIHETHLETIKLDNLTALADTLSIIDNAQLVNISFASLETIGGALIIQDNSQLKVVDGFPQLKQIRGSIEIANNPLQRITFESLKDVAGAVNISTTSQATCKEGELLDFPQKVVKGKFTCQSGVKVTGDDVEAASSTTSIHQYNTLIMFILLYLTIYVYST
jgi:hypothetical protein